LARLAVNFKNAGNGGFFNVFEVPQNGKWMENGRWKMHTAWATAKCGVQLILEKGHRLASRFDATL